MNCLEFRRRLLIDPMALDSDLQAHESGCPSCTAFVRDLRAKEVGLRNLLLDVKAPEGMAERIQLTARFEQNATSLQRWWYGAAAAMLLTVTGSMLALWHTTLERADLALAQSVFDHIDDEIYHLHEAEPVSAARVKYVFERFGASLTNEIGAVTFAAECLMRKRNGIHLVMPGDMGAVTVFFMPEELSKTKQVLSSGRFEGRILPTTWGSIAVVGEIGEPINGLGERLAAAVHWPRAVRHSSTAASRRILVTPDLAQQQDS